ncbi:MAG: PAS domain S-box protein [Deltaproteobacteria bacterium]|nr:PAS domain S-box protein [Deltaproteobacteria bacterium]
MSQSEHDDDDGVPPITEQLREARRGFRDEETGRIRSLVDSDAMFQALVGALPFVLWALDGEGRVIVQNAAARRQFGETLGKRSHETDLPLEVQQTWDANHARALAGEVVEVDFDWVIDGEPRQYRTIIAPIREGGKTRGSIGVSIDVTDKRKTARALEESERRYREIFVHNRAVKLLIDPATGRIEDANPAAAEFYGWSLEQLRGMSITDINTLDAEQVSAEMSRARAEERTHFQFKHRRASGDVRDVEVFSGPIHLDGRELLFSIVHDVTERNQLEEQLRLAQRMEAVGRLAGGVAHDFNNLIAVVLNYAAILERRLPPGAPGREEVDQIATVARKASELTKRLLMFGRREIGGLAVADVNEVARDVAKLFRASAGDGIVLRTELADDVGAAAVQSTQLDQVLLNLLVNARDAIGSEGTITLTTRNVELDDASARRLGLAPGTVYAEIIVEDTGCGMSADVAAHAFEPFFTTKPAGLGTGLGLSVVYGVVRQAGGHVSLRSEAGRGSCFTVLLPTVQRPRGQTG